MSGAIKISALDTLFFRDGKPFSLGEESWAEGLFPPYPSVLYGALRAAFFAENGSQFEKAGSDDDPTRELAITNVYLASEEQCLFPLPLDCLKDGGEKYHHLKLEDWNNLDGVFSSSDTSHVLLAPGLDMGRGKLADVKDMLCDGNQLNDYLDGKKIIRSCGLDDFVTPEPKVGIGRNRFTKSSSDTGMLYRITMSRLSTLHHSLSIVIGYSGLDLQELRFLKLGGEGKAVSCSNDQEVVVDSPDLETGDEELFKIYLATPAIFHKGWYPTLDNVEILTAAIGRPLPVGGFHMRSRDSHGRWRPYPKKLRYAVPAGSVYYCRGSMRDAAERFHGVSISEERSEEGFGIAYVGRLSMGS